MAIGDAVVVFDGRGHEATAIVSNVTPSAAKLSIPGPIVAESPPRTHFTVLQSLIKGDRMTMCVEKLVELGAHDIVLVAAARSVVKLTPDRAEARRNKLQITARQAAQQCRRASVPTIGPVVSLAEAVVAAGEADLAVCLWEAACAVPLARLLPEQPPKSISLLVGPEGGFTDEELAAADAAGFVRAGLGPRILRAETAALAGLVALGFVLGDLGETYLISED